MKTIISLRGTGILVCCAAIGVAMGLALVKANTPTLRQASDSSAYTFVTLAGNGGTEESTLGAWKPRGIAVDGQGNIYFTDMRHQVICRTTLQGLVTVIAGKRDVIGSTDGKGSEARFRFPQGIALDKSGNIYVADTGNDTIRRITPGGMVSTLAGKAMIAGANDGAGNDARFNYPCDIAIDPSGALYVADLYNFIIRKVTTDGLVTTVAGQAGQSDNLDGSAREAKFESPSGITVDHAGNVYVADTAINCIRKISPAGQVTTLAGKRGYIQGKADGSGQAAQFSHPFGLAADTAGNIFVADLENQAIRRIAPDGTVATLAEFAGPVGINGESGSPAAPGKPFRIALDQAGNLYVSDVMYPGIRKGTPGLASSVPLTAK